MIHGLFTGTYLPATCRFYFEFEHCTITVSKHVFGKLSNWKEEGQHLYMGHQKINHSFTHKLLSNFSRNLLWSAISLHWFLCKCSWVELQVFFRTVVCDCTTRKSKKNVSEPSNSLKATSIRENRQFMLYSKETLTPPPQI